MTLQTKYRPKFIKDLAGNITLKKSLQSIIEEGTARTLMFFGAPGSGKTTTARCLANEMGIKEVQELNASSNRGIDEARRIEKEAYYLPVMGKKKMYILDEVHELTKQALEALLKIIEEPPEHVIFVLCTSEPQKLKASLRRRGYIFELKPLTKKQSISLLTKVAQEYNIDIPTECCEAIYNNTGGTAGNLIQLLGMVANSPDDWEDIVEDAVISTTEDAEVIELCRMLVRSNTSFSSIQPILKKLTPDAESCRKVVLGYLNSTLLNRGDVLVAERMSYFTEPMYEKGAFTLACFQALM